MSDYQASRTMAIDDVLAAAVLVLMGWWARQDHHPAFGWSMMLLGSLWCALRIYHLVMMRRKPSEESRATLQSEYGDPTAFEGEALGMLIIGNITEAEYRAAVANYRARWMAAKEDRSGDNEGSPP